MAHYVGDSCQPLHIAYKFNGDPGRKDAETGKSHGSGVHDAYESDMLRAHAPEMLARLNTTLGIGPGHLGDHGFHTFCQSGHDAAVATVDLMRKAFNTIDVNQIIEVFVEDEAKLWDRFGDDTVQLLAEGSRTLAMIWESAWRTPGNSIRDLGPADLDALITLYENPDWAPSVTLDEIAPILAGRPPGPPQAEKPRSRTRPKDRA